MFTSLNPPSNKEMEKENSNITRDPRILGKGAVKTIWLKIPNKYRNNNYDLLENTVVVNSSNTQRKENEKNFSEYKKFLKNEYDFTVYMRKIFPQLIPEVTPLTGTMPFDKFRYNKQRCIVKEDTADVFDEMIKISDYLIENGWAYLDMKPDNLGECKDKTSKDKTSKGLPNKTMLIDTDPASFYMVPEKFRNLYKICCHMIILIQCFRYFDPKHHKHMEDFIQKNGYSEEIFEKNYKDSLEYIDRGGRPGIKKFSDISKHNRDNKNMWIPMKPHLPSEIMNNYGLLIPSDEDYDKYKNIPNVRGKPIFLLLEHLKAIEKRKTQT